MEQTSISYSVLLYFFHRSVNDREERRKKGTEGKEIREKRKK